MFDAVRPMTLGELLDRTFQLYRRHFLLFVGIMALPQLAILALQLSRPDMGPLDNNNMAEVLARLGSTLLWTLSLAVASFVVGSAAQGATVIAVSELHLGRTASIAGAYKAIWRRIALLCLIGLIYGISVGFGLLLFIVPGILLALVWSLLVPVAVIEGVGFVDAAQRSRFLTKGFRFPIFITFVLFVVLTMVVSAIWQIPLGVATFAAARAGTPGELPVWARLLAPIGAFVTQSLAGPLLTIALSLMYYDLRVRKEGFDLELMMAKLDGLRDNAPTAGV